MTDQNNAAQAADQDPLSDEYVNAVIQRHGYQSPETVIARLYQWMGRHGGENGVTLLMYEAHKALSKLRAPVAGQPFMYGIMGPDGKAHFEEFCVSGNRDELQAEVVDHLNRDNPEDGLYSVVSLFRDAAPQASAGDARRALGGYQTDSFRALKTHPAPAAAKNSAEARKPVMTLAEFCEEADRIGLTADTLAAQLAARPEFADCLPQAGDGSAGSAKGSEDVALPPLPSPPQHRGHAMFAGSQMLAYARTSVLADRQRRAMSLEEILTEFRRGCSNTVGRGPENCPECVRAFVSALKALSGCLLDGREWNEVPR